MAPTTHSSGFPGNRVKALLRAGRPAFGIFATIPSVAIVQIMAASELDWVLIDMEHGAIDYATAHAMIAATTGTRLVPIESAGGACYSVGNRNETHDVLRSPQKVALLPVGIS